MEFRILGALEVVDGAGEPLELGGSQPRALLAVLVTAAGRGLSTDTLIDAIWGEQPPASAAGTLQSYVSRLRAVFQRAGAEHVLRREPTGYRLDIEPDEVDFRRFEQLADQGRTLVEQRQYEDGREVLLGAERLWRGPALVEFADRDFARGLASRLEERRLAAVEDRLTADLALGRAGAVVGELTEQVARHPMREGLRACLALALYRSGRQADALRSLDEARAVLRDELGVDPSPPLRELERRILAQDPTLSLEAATAAASPASVAGMSGDSAPTTAADPAVASGAVWPVVGPSAWPLVGRDVELAQLVRTVDDHRAGARFVVVEGEPGVGKTRLAEEVAREAIARGQLMVWGRCHEGGASPAFWAWLGALRSLVESSPALVPGADPALEVLLTPHQDEPESRLGGFGRFQLFDAVASALSAAAAERPLVVVLDDVQWADQASLELLSFLAGRLSGEPVLVLCTVRQLEVGRHDAVVDTLAAVSRRPRSLRLRLSGLDAAATHALVNESCCREVPSDVAAAIYERAEGNAFYATELARLLVLEDCGPDDGMRSPLDVPAGVRDVIRQRLARLPEPTARLLRVGAVIGRDLPIGLLTGAADLEPDQVLDDLEPALVHRILVEVPDRFATFRFSHALVREVLLEDMSTLRRARLHLRVADAIGDSADDDMAEILAEHLWSAAPIGVGLRAAAALERAAGVAIRRLAVDAAEQLLERALDLRRAGGAADGGQAELLTLTRLIGVRRALRGYASVMDLAVRGQELARRLGREDVLRELRFAEWSGADTACNFARARPIAIAFLAEAEATDDIRVRLNGYHVWGIQCWHDGRIDESVRYLDLAAEIAAANPWEPDPLGMDYEHQVVAASFRLHSHDLAGDYPDIEDAFLAHAARQTDRFAVSLVWGFAAAGAAAVGDVERTYRAVQRGLAADPDVLFTFYGAGMQLAFGGAEVAMGMVEQGIARVEAARRRLLANDTRTTQCSYIALLAINLVDQDCIDEARRFATLARTELDTYGERWAAPLVMLAEAKLARVDERPADEVAELFAAAEAEAVRQGSLGIAAHVARVASR